MSAFSRESACAGATILGRDSGSADRFDAFDTLIAVISQSRVAAMTGGRLFISRSLSFMTRQYVLSFALWRVGNVLMWPIHQGRLAS